MLHLWYKRVDNLSESEEKHLGDLAEAILLQVEAENEKENSNTEIAQEDDFDFFDFSDVDPFFC